MSELLAARAVSLALAVAFDLVLGDPGGPRHPVVLLGRLIARIERLLRARGADSRIGGAVLAAIVVGVGTATAFALSVLAWRVDPLAGVLADALLIWPALAARTLAAEGIAVGGALGGGTIEAARERIGRIVGRDTQQLDDAGVARACVESLGENLVDAVLAPLFWAALLGPAGAWLHKAASTLDSMVGYRNERFARIGWASAKFDDLLAFVPARLAPLLVAAAAHVVPGASPLTAWRVGWRDRLLHDSPNSAHGEAAFAGALQVSLGGAATYLGVTRAKPLIGAEFDAPPASACVAAARLVIASSIIAAAATVAVLALLALA